jgi:hypothetical protein
MSILESIKLICHGSIIDRTIAEVEEVARNYWRGKNQEINKREILWDCRVRILHKLDT